MASVVDDENVSYTKERQLTAMMSNMQVATPNRAYATPEFVALCKTLYGDLIDAQVIWSDVVKASPDQADVSTHAKRTNFERGTNAVGFTAGLMATSAALRDPRLNDEKAHKLARGLYRIGNSVPERFRVSSRTGALGAALATGAVGTQILNSTGDALIGESYARRAKQTDKHKKVAIDKGVSEEIARAARKMKKGYLKLWNPDKATVMTDEPLVEGTRRARKVGEAKAANAKANERAASQSSDVTRMMSTTSGKVLAGGVATAGAFKVDHAIKNRKNDALYASQDAYYGKSDDDITWAGTFSKFDDDKHLAFGWASVVSKGGVPVIDKQGDYIGIDDIEAAAYTYVNKSRVGGDNHTRDGESAHKVSDLVESMVFTDDKIAKMGLPDDFPRGWWVGFKVHDPETWSEVRKGNRTGFSIHGKGVRKDQSVDEIMGYAHA